MYFLISLLDARAMYTIGDVLQRNEQTTILDAVSLNGENNRNTRQIADEINSYNTTIICKQSNSGYKHRHSSAI